ncbi:hypothetical protein [Streptomyces coelicoflavus]|uniref:hypothetical protein n=1 Tax=Streptomyces coelicoflavus TaxID=285562 RepID=UPI00362B8407
MIVDHGVPQDLIDRMFSTTSTFFYLPDHDASPLRIVDWVARRGPGGRWRYVVDNPFGTGAEPAGSAGAEGF